MAIFNSNNSYVSESSLPSYPNMAPTSEASDLIIYDFAKDISTIIEATYVADIMIETAILEESISDVDAATEGVVSDVIAKIKEALKKFWGKVKEWFKSVKRFFTLRFGDHVKFINEYEQDIKDRINVVSGFEMEGYDYKLKEAEKIITKVTDVANNEVTTGLSANSVIITDPKGKDKAEALAGTSLGKSDTDEYTVAICKACDGKSSIGEIEESIMKTFRNNAKEESKIKIKAEDVFGAISFIKKNASIVSEFENQGKVTERTIETAIADFDKLDKSLKDKDAAGIATLINRIAANARICLSIIQTMNKCRKTVYSEYENSRMDIIRKLFAVKVRKNKDGTMSVRESYTGDGSGDSILESAMKLL